MDCSNPELLAWLFTEGKIAIRQTALFASAPPPLPADFSWDRVEGMLLGIAVGDSLGNATEGQPPLARQVRYGLIRDYVRYCAPFDHPVGIPSDDTQLSFWTLEQLIEDGGLAPDHLARRFCREPIFGVGSTVRRFVEAYTRGVPWWEAGQPSAGNGALMRIAPVLVPHLKAPSPLLWIDTALAAMLTHNDPAAIASCLGWVRLLWSALGMAAAPEHAWWLETFCDTVEEVEGDSRYFTRIEGRTYEGPLGRFTRDVVRQALDAGWSAREACARWRSGAYLLETVPSVLYILCRHAHDPEEAIVRAVNDTVDNDTIGAIVGAAVGTLHGKARLPSRWIGGLLGRTAAADDGRAFELIEAARRHWFCGA